MKLSTKVSLATLVAGGVYAGVKAYELVKTGKTTVFGFVTIINEDKYHADGIDPDEWYKVVTKEIQDKSDKSAPAEEKKKTTTISSLTSTKNKFSD